MRYSEILGLYEHFQPNYDITNEQRDYWKRFIFTKKFFDVLRDTLNSLEHSIKEKSIWVQGTYGTGKSHATAVIKHLIWDDLEGIDDFISGLTDVQIREHMRNFRNTNRIFPVLLKGASNITDNRSFALVIGRAVKEALRNLKIEIFTKSDFEKMIFHLEDDRGIIDWEKVFENNERLRPYINSKEDLLNKLKNDDITILRILEDYFIEVGIDPYPSRIDKWLAEVSEELRTKKIANSVMIFWDEFTSVLELEKAREIMVELQNIAELSDGKNVFLFVVSHRNPSQVLPQDDIEKLHDRFYFKRYDMEPLTTYHIISRSIMKKNEDKWSELKEIHLETKNDLRMLASKLVDNEGVSAITAIKDLFPIHPYTAYLATFIARNIGSTERSIFSFLYDKERGFLKFIEEHPQGDSDIYLTVNYLWDFFLEDFDIDSSDRFGSVLDRYKIYAQKFENKSEYYTNIFKGVILLNILSRFIDALEPGRELIAPSLENVQYMFLGTQFEIHVEEVLDYINVSGCIPKTPDGFFLISSASLPPRELESERNKVENNYEDITKALELQEKEFIRTLVPIVIREKEIRLYHASIKKHILVNRLQNDFKKTSALHIALFLMREENEREVVNSLIDELSTKEEFKNIILAVIHEPLKNENFKKFIDYSARSSVASSHNFREDEITNDKYAQNIIGIWIGRIRDGFIELNFRGKRETYPFSGFNDKVNEKLSPQIFEYGLEKLDKVQQNSNLWTRKDSKTSAEIFLFARSRDYIEERTSTGVWSPLRGIIKDNKDEYIVDESLEIKQDADFNHPLIKITNEVSSRIENLESRTVFNLGKELQFLTEPPYGIYANMANMALIGFVMRPFVGKLYEIGTGKPIENELMRDKIQSLFRFWEKSSDSNKLEVRLGTTKERELVSKLKEIFNLDETATSLTNTRWKVREWAKDSQYPLWSFKTFLKKSGKDAIDEIFKLTQSFDKEISQDQIINALDIIEKNEVDLKHELKKDRAREGFVGWLKNVEKISISDEKTVDEITVFLKEQMQEEIASWEEAEVKENVFIWKLEKYEQASTPSVEGVAESNRSRENWGTKVDDSNGKYTPTEPPQSDEKETGKREELEKAKTRINEYKGDFKALIIRIIEENPPILGLMLSYLRREEKNDQGI
ncbi:MAG: hypothetical protein HXS54_16620 [Theionarchaea archaeon]|nr:hypothetical protein [Theionarchaea archaeon]